MTAIRVVISGLVQGVGYRDWMCAQARERGVSGWVRNRSDGTVEALVDGDPGAVQELLRACRRGPRLAQVTGVTEHFADPPEEPGFVRRPTL
jgi:acylphosphatase